MDGDEVQMIIPRVGPGRKPDEVRSVRIRIDGYRKRGIDTRQDKTFAWLDVFHTAIAIQLALDRILHVILFIKNSHHTIHHARIQPHCFIQQSFGMHQLHERLNILQQSAILAFIFRDPFDRHGHLIDTSAHRHICKILVQLDLVLPVLKPPSQHQIANVLSFLIEFFILFGADPFAFQFHRFFFRHLESQAAPLSGWVLESAIHRDQLRTINIVDRARVPLRTIRPHHRHHVPNLRLVFHRSHI